MRSYSFILTAAVMISGCAPTKARLFEGGVDTRVLLQRKSQVALREAAAALSDSNHRGLGSPGSAGLALKEFALQDVVSQTCTETATGAAVTIKSSETTSMEMDSLEKNYKKDVFVNAEVVRSYAGGDDLECARKKPIIEVDLDRHLVEMTLDVKHRREEKTFVSELTKPAPVTTTTNADGTTTTSTVAAPPPAQRQMSTVASIVEGTRKVTFTAKVADDNDLRSYSKESVGTGTRKETVQSSNAVDEQLEFSIQSNFKMIDTYDENKRDHAVGAGPVSKEVTSGTVKATLKGDGYVETTFTGVKLEFAQGACKATAGKIQTKFFAEGGTSPQKTVDFDVASNTVSVSVLVASSGVNPSNDKADILASTDIQKDLCSNDAFLD